MYKYGVVLYVHLIKLFLILIQLLYILFNPDFIFSNLKINESFEKEAIVILMNKLEFYIC